jgi:hypothetical protein
MEINRPDQEEHDNPEKIYPTERYEIKVQGRLDSLWGEWFDGMLMSYVENGEGSGVCTLLSGQVEDQAQLHGFLMKIRDLNLKLLSVRRINPANNHGEDISINIDL